LKRVFLQTPGWHDLRLDDNRGYTRFDYQDIRLLCSTLDAAEIF
jgi:hypothetical protein